MSEQAPEAAPDVTSGAEPEPEPFDPERAQAKIKKANDEARNLRARLKELEPLAQEAEKQREAQKTETQRLIEERDALRAERDAVQSEAMRTRVAFSKGLPPELTDRLRGATEDELSEDADRLLALLKPSGPTRFGDPGLGPRASTPAATDDGRQVARQLFGAT